MKRKVIENIFPSSPRRGMRALIIVAFLAVGVLSSTAAQGPSYDLVIRNGRIADGSGSPWYRGDVAIRGDTIVRVAPSIADAATRILDAAGEVIAPGFIDIHSHAREGIFESPAAENYIRQGVTTIIEGPDGSSPLPIAEFLAKLDALPKTVNIGTMVGQGSVRAAVIGLADRKPTAGELDKMRALVEHGMKEGGREKILARLKDPGLRADIKAEMVRAIQNERGGGDPKNVVLARCEWDESLSGKNLAEVTRMRGMDVTLPNAAEAAMWIVEQGNCSGIFHAIAEDDLRRILRHLATMIASDGGIPIFGKANQHPRNYGTFARILAYYVREINIFTHEDA